MISCVLFSHCFSQLKCAYHKPPSSFLVVHLVELVAAKYLFAPCMYECFCYTQKCSCKIKKIKALQRCQHRLHASIGNRSQSFCTLMQSCDSPLQHLDKQKQQLKLHLSPLSSQPVYLCVGVKSCLHLEAYFILCCYSLC